MLKFEPVDLDYTLFEPFITQKQTNTHYNGHYMKYIFNFNNFLNTNNDLKKIYQEVTKNSNNKIFRKSLLLVINELFNKNSDIVHNVAQIYNHELYWKTLTNYDNSEKYLTEFKNKLFINDSNYKTFTQKYIKEGIKHFGSGWLWIILNNDNKLDIITTHDAIIPSTKNILGVIDLWEHAYYLDYESERKKYLENTLKIINWKRIYNKM